MAVISMRTFRLGRGIIRDRTSTGVEETSAEQAVLLADLYGRAGEGSEGNGEPPNLFLIEKSLTNIWFTREPSSHPDDANDSPSGAATLSIASRHSTSPPPIEI